MEYLESVANPKLEVRVHIGRRWKDQEEDFTGLEHLGSKGMRLSGYSLITKEVVEECGFQGRNTKSKYAGDRAWDVLETEKI